MILYTGTGEVIELSSGRNVLAGKNLVILADSLFDYEQPEGRNIGEYIAAETGATVYNWAQGGCCMAKGKATNYDPYSFVGLIDALVDRDFTDQIANAEERSFTTQVAEMQNFDMANCDFMVVAYGANDFFRNCQIENASNNKDVTTFKGATRYGIEKLLTAYPSIKLMFLNVPPLPPQYIDAGGVGYIYTTTYSAAIESVCGDYSIPVLDVESNSMLSSLTSSALRADATHFNRAGKNRYMNLIVNALNLYY